MSVGIQQNNNVHEIVTLTGKVNIEARNISECFSKTARVSHPHGRGSAHRNPTPVYLAVALRALLPRGAKLRCLRTFGQHTE